MTVWYTSDQHFGHESIIDYCHRPFRRVGEMDRSIIYNYRKVVAPEDTVYMLGDLTIKGPQYRGYLEYIVDQLPGKKILIIGNHDKFDPFVYMELGFLHVHTLLDNGEFIMVHDPAIATRSDDQFWLCGHVHTVFKMAKKNHLLNVGVDQWGFFPVSETELKEAFKAANEDI